MTGTEILVTAGGVALIAALGWFFFGPKQARRAEVRGGVQEVEITVKGGYSPNLIRADGGRAAAAGLRPPGEQRLLLAGRLPRLRGEQVAGRVRPDGGRAHARRERASSASPAG